MGSLGLGLGGQVIHPGMGVKPLATSLLQLGAMGYYVPRGAWSDKEDALFQSHMSIGGHLSRVGAPAT